MTFITAAQLMPIPNATVQIRTLSLLLALHIEEEIEFLTVTSVQCVYVSTILYWDTSGAPSGCVSFDCRLCLKNLYRAVQSLYVF